MSLPSRVLRSFLPLPQLIVGAVESPPTARSTVLGVHLLKLHLDVNLPLPLGSFTGRTGGGMRLENLLPALL